MKAGSILLSSFRRRLSDSLILVLSTALSVLAIEIFTAAARSEAVRAASEAKRSIAMLFTDSALVVVSFAALSGWFYAEHYLARRLRELAVWLLSGMRKRMAAAILAAEFGAAALGAFLFGTLISIVFSRFFSLALQALMREREPTPLFLDTAALGAGAGACAFQFLAAILRALIILNRIEISRLMSSERRPELPPKARRLKAGIGLLALALGYAGAVASRGAFAALLMLPVLILTILGTFLIFGSLVPALAERQRRRGLASNPALLVAAAQISFRSQRNAGLHALSAVLIAVAATASGTVLAFGLNESRVQRRIAPHELELRFTAADEEEAARHIGDIEAALRSQGARDLRSIRAEFLPAELHVSEGRQVFAVSVFSKSSWNAALAALGEQGKPVETGRIRSTQAWMFSESGSAAKEAILILSGRKRAFHPYPEAALPPYSMLNAVNALVVSDEEYKTLRQGLDPKDVRVLLAWNGVGAEGMAQARSRLEALGLPYLKIRISLLKEHRSIQGALLFVGVFLAALFLLAAAALLIFRATEDARSDSERYRAVVDLGAPKNLIRRTFLIQAAFGFGLPSLFGLAHSAFALAMMRHISGLQSLKPTIIVAGSSIPIMVLAALFAVNRMTARISP